ncbi:uncharacterized protein LOC121267465 [Juglans microcarpa x Juglans regia]|uniref:uncharacterized protein LOC121267465 n=1 Tax=Juglans microcarpa x Juglans regia TaxID=2249226 RepID=UPI001B7E393E|nr:uncharacterized protein LOC121267465 [Juglans microcarpa x Juglans regia]
MKHLAWNYRGLGNPRTVRELHLMVKEKCPNVVFLSETKCRRKRIELTRDKLSFDHCFSVDSIGRSGGIAIFWKREIEAELDSYSHNHISISASSNIPSKKRTVTGFYGQPTTAKRSASWDLLRLIHSRTHNPWLCMGDFNEIMFQDEYFGSNTRPFKQMEEFRLALSDCGLMDIGFGGSKFTWCNKREGFEFTKCGLDRALVNDEWLNLFYSNQVLVLPGQCSDHNPLFINCFNSAQVKAPKHKIFRYEVAWGKREGCTELIKAAWLQKPPQASKLDFTREGLNVCRDKLKIWSKEAFRQQKRLLYQKREQLRLLQVQFWSV